MVEMSPFPKKALEAREVDMSTAPQFDKAESAIPVF